MEHAVIFLASCRAQRRRILFMLAPLGFLLPSAQISAAALPPIQVILVGDSTMTSNAGYGAALCKRFTAEVTCKNLARSGRSSASFRGEGLWHRVEHLLRDGGRYRASYVLIQFGHNDQPGKPGRSTDLVTEFPANMARYAAEVKAWGGTPVLITPLTRRTFRGPNLHDDLGPWAAATRHAARQEHAVLLDLNANSAAAVQQMGQDEADTLAIEPRPAGLPRSTDNAADHELPRTVKTKFDWTHLGPKGANYFSGIVAREFAQAVPDVAPYLHTQDE